MEGPVNVPLREQREGVRDQMLLVFGQEGHDIQALLVRDAPVAQQRLGHDQQRGDRVLLAALVDEFA